MTILVVGATGTLGRQVVRQALDEGYPVRCLVRNVRKANFLREWGAELVYGDLKLPETLPNTLKGITVVIDAATLRPEEEFATLKEVDLIGKIALIKAAKVANIKRYIFFSIANNEKFPNIPLMRLKTVIENVLKTSEIPYTIFQISGFYQGIISQYAIPILEQQEVSTTQDAVSISYINTQDAAKFCTRSLQLEETTNQTFSLVGPKDWVSDDIIKLCEEISGQAAKVSFTPLILLKIIRQIISFSQWGWDIQDRLAFSEVLNSNTMNVQSRQELYKIFKFESTELLSLESYLQEYFEKMLKKLRDLNYNQSQAAKRKDLTF
jgi:uncharacterized protein YbjT (DUF2867 family)|tara:strand:+ start:1135 stop:2103 length:969 start_codon:yes stop_codon:yes gene_type:complete